MKTSINSRLLGNLISSGSITNYEANFSKDDKGKFTLSNLVVQGEDLFKTFGTNGELEFKDCEFENATNFAPHSHKTSLIFTDCIFKDIVAFTRGNDNMLVFNDCEFKNLNIVAGSYSDIQINGCNGSCSINTTRFKSFLLGNWTNDKRNQFGSVELNLDQASGMVQILRSSFGLLSIKGNVPKDTSVVIDSIEAKHFELSWLTVEGLLRVNNLKPTQRFLMCYEDLRHSEEEQVRINRHFQKSFFLINKSDLGKSHFSSIDMRAFHLVNIGQSNINEVTFNTIAWPEIIFGFSHVLKKDIGDYLLRIPKLSKQEQLQTREVYRQLKQAAIKGADFISEQYFHGKEMNAYYAALNWKKNFWTKIILRLSYLTANYGQSLWRPTLCLAISTGIVMFVLWEVQNTSYQSCDFLRPQNLIDSLAEFMRLANPLHKNNCELKGMPFIIDTTGRIFNSYFIYNIIRASRRFVR